ncbi:hypothetical protein BKA65DRAFT_548721 [Rhexocercosporidium sp. MPI-PUGE-AT-0058]|nr:hypothetical protein BKA65DRAFT_548721 [Rhexocercosporidium sp. MPI-PUGE-AT-0058]
MQIRIITVLAAFVSLVQGTITKPAAGDQWIIGEKSTITWDTAGFSDKVDIALVPAGATDTSVIIAQIATATANTGSQTWTPPSTMKGGDVSVIIVNSQQSSAASSASVTQTSSSSGIFVIVISSGSNGSKSNGSHGSKNNSTETGAGVLTTISLTATMTSHITVAANITTPQTSQPTATDGKSTVVYPAAPFANLTTTTTAEAAIVTAPSQTLLTSVSGTGGGGPQQTFTGAAAALEMSTALTMVSSGVTVLMAIFFL